MADLVRQSRVIWTDDTTIPVLDPDRDRTKTGRIWVYIGDLRHRYAVFDYTPDRSGERPREFLGRFSGYLQADAYSGYDQLCDRGDVTEVACWAHARRKFFDARDSARVGANQALKLIGKLYEIERQVARLDNQSRLRIRQDKSLLQLAEIKGWLDKQAENILPKSPLGQAIRYALNHWTALRRYTEDAELTIDNIGQCAAMRLRWNWVSS